MASLNSTITIEFSPADRELMERFTAALERAQAVLPLPSPSVPAQPCEHRVLKCSVSYGEGGSATMSDFACAVCQQKMPTPVGVVTSG